MALAQIYTAIGGDTITAARWNNEFGNIYTNGTDISFPLTKAVSLAGFTLTLDAAGATTLVSSATQAFQMAPGSKSGTPGINGSFINLAAATFTDSNTAGSGTATQWNGVTFRAPTLAASNTLVTTTDAATVYIEGPPTAGTNETITNPWSLFVDSGNVRFDANVYWLSGTSFQGILDHANTVNRTYTFQDSSDTIVGRATTDTLTNKTLTSPTLTSPTLTGTPTITSPLISGEAPATPVANTLYADSFIKGWVKFNVAGVIDDDINVSSITDSASGIWVINWATAFANDTYAVSVSLQFFDTTDATLYVGTVDPVTVPTTTTCRILSVGLAAGTQATADPGTNAKIHVMAIGNQ